MVVITELNNLMSDYIKNKIFEYNVKNDTDIEYTIVYGWYGNIVNVDCGSRGKYSITIDCDTKLDDIIMFVSKILK